MRFKYHTNWHSSYLGEIVDYCGGGTPSTKNKSYWNGNIPWISSSDLYEDDIYKINKTRFITEQAIQNSATKLCPKESICIVSRVGVGKVAVTQQELCTSQDFFNIIKCNINKYFFAYQIQQKIKIAQQQGTSIKGITSKEIQNFKIWIPSENEQDKISFFLKLIDKRIQTQIKIISDYKTLKKGINYFLIGRYTPNTFISECLKCNTSSLKESEIIDENLGMFPVYGANGIIKNINTYMMDSSSISIVKDGAGAGRLNYLSGKYSFIGTLNCFTIKKGYNLKYIYYALENINFNRYIVGSGIPHVYYNDFKQEKIYIPADTKEIDKIEKCLSSIDSVIELETKKLSKLTLQKKYLINNMFI